MMAFQSIFFYSARNNVNFQVIIIYYKLQFISHLFSIIFVTDKRTSKMTPNIIIVCWIHWLLWSFLVPWRKGGKMSFFRGWRRLGHTIITTTIGAHRAILGQYLMTIRIFILFHGCGLKILLIFIRRYQWLSNRI